MVVSVLCLLLPVPWVGLQCVIVAFPGHIHLFFEVQVPLVSKKICLFVCLI